MGQRTLSKDYYSDSADSFFVAIYNYINSVIDDGRREEQARRNAVLYAYSLIDQYTVSQVEFIDRSLLGMAIRGATKDIVNPGAWEQPKQIEDGMISLAVSTFGLQEMVNSLYNVFESQYGRSEQLENRIDYEVTFMTKSYVDDEITIPAYANRARRQPLSMSHRSANKEIYRKTITASVYNETAPRLRIIPDTVEPATGYTELYSGQRERIRSTAVFPVMCDKNRILGTLVVHCNAAGFFQEKDRRFWTELLEIFSKRVAVEKVRLDAVVDKAKTEGKLSIFGREFPLPF